jgi:protein ImuA
MGEPASRRQLIEGLREQIRRIERKPGRRAASAASGWEEVDRRLPGGGFPHGALSEVTGGPASGKTALALSVVAGALRRGALAAWVDGGGELYPPAAAALGVDLERLLIVRPPEVSSTRGDGGAVAGLWAAEALLGSGAFEVVAIDLVAAIEQARRAPDERMLRRLVAATEKGGAVGLWLGAPGAVRAPAAVRLELEALDGTPRVVRATARGAEPSAQPLAGSSPAGGGPRARLVRWRGTHHAA